MNTYKAVVGLQLTAKAAKVPQVAVQLATIALLDGQNELQWLVVLALRCVLAELHALLKHMAGDLVALVLQAQQVRVKQLQLLRGQGQSIRGTSQSTSEINIKSVALCVAPS